MGYFDKNKLLVAVIMMIMTDDDDEDKDDNSDWEQDSAETDRMSTESFSNE